MDPTQKVDSSNFHLKTETDLDAETWCWDSTELRKCRNQIMPTVKNVEEWKTNLMSLAILFRLLCAQHVSDINIPIIRSLRLCCWITTSVVLFCKDGWFSVNVNLRCVVVCVWCDVFCRLNAKSSVFTEQDDRCGNSTTQSQTPDDGHINVRNMLSA